jgi:pimeloyl-ACP methyl ester carboxylesterase
MKFSPRPLFSLALLAGGLACNLATSAPPSLSRTAIPSPPTVVPLSPQPTPSTEVPYQPIFEPAPCAFSTPGGYNPECGYLIVPENRTRPAGPRIRLHVAIFRSRASASLPEPVVHLAGGPGSSSLDVAGYMFGQGLDAVLNQQDLILFDQRGTGYSQPRLDCPERTSVTEKLLQIGLASEEAQGLIVDAFRQCRERLIAQGIDLSAYTSAASAADLNDLRQVLGYEKLNLYGVSYGTRLALTFLRDYPGAVQSAVLDSVYPLQINLYTALAPNAERAFNVFFQRCASDATCNTAHPNLGAEFYQLVDQLNAAPLELKLYAAGADRTVRLDGGLLIDVLFVGLYNPVVTASMPQMIYAIQQGNYTILRERLALYFDTGSALGMQMAVQCAEELPFNSVEQAFAAAGQVQSQIAVFYPRTVQPLFVACPEWTTSPQDPRENLPVQSAVPTLILAGEHDPITPPEWGQMVAADLSTAFFYQFPGNGHWVTRSSRCALEMSLAFWRNPGVDPRAVCQP